MREKELRSIARSLHSRTLHGVPWSGEIWCTRNFANTVAQDSAEDLYLRAVDNLLRFSDGSCLLVSERETHSLLGMLWDLPYSSPTQFASWAAAQRMTAAQVADLNGPPVLSSLVYARRQLVRGERPQRRSQRTLLHR